MGGWLDYDMIADGIVIPSGPRAGARGESRNLSGLSKGSLGKLGMTN